MPKLEKRLVRHSDRTNYVVWVLWVMGLSETDIAMKIGKRRKQVTGIVNRSPYSNRSAMTDEDRQKHLTELWAIRIGDDGRLIDGGILDRMPRGIIPLPRRAAKRGG